MEIGIFANESDDNFLGSRDLDDEYESEYLVRFESKRVILHLQRHIINLLYIGFAAARLPRPANARQFRAVGRRGRGRVGLQGAGRPHRVSGHLRPSRLR